jgi:hypothetical protein
VEIAIRNTGKKPIELPQHRFNIYDYYPRTRFAVTDDRGKRTLLAKSVGDMDESDEALIRSLAPGEVYIHTVRLNRWPVAPEELDRQDAHNPLLTPGTYSIECTYTNPPNTSWPLTLTAAPVKVTITAPEKAASSARQRGEWKKTPAVRQDSPPATEPEDVFSARTSVATLVHAAGRGVGKHGRLRKAFCRRNVRPLRRQSGSPRPGTLPDRQGRRRV